MSVFVHAQGIKLSTQGGGVKKWQNSVHVVVECPLTINLSLDLHAELSLDFQILEGW